LLLLLSSFIFNNHYDIHQNSCHYCLPTKFCMDLISSTMKSLYSTRVSQLHYRSIVIKSSVFTWSISFITLSPWIQEHLQSLSHLWTFYHFVTFLSNHESDILKSNHLSTLILYQLIIVSTVTHIYAQSSIYIDSISTDNCKYSHTYLCTTQNISKYSINTNRSYISAQTISNQDNVSHWNTSTTFTKVFYYQEIIVCIAVRNNNSSHSPFPSLLYPHPRQHFTLSFLYISFFTAPAIMNIYVYQ
jgi:hypothetical protein